MRTRNLDGLRLALSKISPQQIGTHRAIDTVSRALLIPGVSLSRAYGLPQPIVAALDGLFLGLAWIEARQVAIGLPGAIGRPDRDLRPVVWRVLEDAITDLQKCAKPLPTCDFYRRVGHDLIEGLSAAARRRPWLGAAKVLGELPRGLPPPHGLGNASQLARLEYEVRNALAFTALALIAADSAVVAALRLRACQTDERAEIAQIAHDAEGRVGEMVREIMRSCVEAGAISAGLREQAQSERAAAVEAARCDGYRRLAAMILERVAEA